MREQATTDLPSDRLSFVLPIRGARDISSARLNLLPSLDVFFDLNDIEEILVVGTQSEYRGMDFSENVSPALAARIRILSEQEIIGNERQFRLARGRHRQQIVKLMISQRVRTRLYCTLDSDMYLVRRCRLADWVVRGRCIYNAESGAAHPAWWTCAARELNYDPGLAAKGGFGVTPALLYTDIVKELLEYLETSGRGLMRAIRKGATEYTLYWLFTNREYLVEKLYDPRIGWLYARCLWSAQDIHRGDVLGFIDRQFEAADPFYFSIIQSNSGLATQRVIEHVRAHILARTA